VTGQVLFSIIIANYNKGDNIRPLLASIYAHPECEDFEVLFMDDSSTDSSLQEAARFPVRLYPGSERVGPATLRNRASREACGEYLLFVDSDVILPVGTIQRFREICLAGGIGAVSGLEVLPPVINNWIGWFRTLQVQDYFGEYRHKEGPLDAWGSTLGGVRRELFFRCGGFNEAYRGADVEDHELAIKLKGLEPMIFSPFMTYRHSYPSAAELVAKQFRRASQMIQLDERMVLKSSLLFRWRFKGGHILSAVLVVAGIAALFKPGFFSLFALLLLLKLWLNGYLFTQAFRLKGLLFMFYAVSISLVMGVSIVAGALYGKTREVLR
jgi:glycosyltransferase involved in cell wall biosynthesis